jgi:hypothetical protein
MAALNTTTYGTPTYNGTNAKFGTNGLSGGAINGTAIGNFLSSTGADGGTLTTGTIEAWVKATTAGALKVIASHAGWWYLGMDSAGKAFMEYGWGAGTNTQLTGTTTIGDGNWHHVALVLTAGAGSLYVDGNREGTSATVRSTSAYNGTTLVVGTHVNSASSFLWPGSIDEVRLSNVARYTGTTYTVPTAAFSPDLNTKNLYHLEAPGGLDSAIRTNYCKNPSFEVDTATWDLGGLTRVTSQSYIGGASVQTIALSTAVLSIAYGFSSNAKTASSVAVVPGDVWTISFYAKSVSVASHSVGIRTLWMNSGGSWVSDTGNPLNTTVTTGGWIRVTATVTVPANIAWMGFAPVGTQAIYMDAVLIENAVSADTYFDGSTFAVGEISAWNGTAHASTSTTTPGTPTQTSSAVEYINLNAGVEAAMLLKSDAVEPVLMNAGVESPMALKSDAAEPVLLNTLENDSVEAGGWGPSVVRVDTGAVTTAANPTVTLTATPLTGDVLILATFCGDPNAAIPTAVSGCGATWTRIPGGSSNISGCWIGTGATSTGTITATAGATTWVRALRVHHLRGVTADAVYQDKNSTYKARGTSNQVVIGYGFVWGSSPGTALNSYTPPQSSGWIDQSEIVLRSDRMANSTYRFPKLVDDCYVLANGGSGATVVVGSPVPGATVTRRNPVWNSSIETATTGYGATNASIAVSAAGNPAMFGTRSLKMTASGSAPTAAANSNVPGVPISEGQTYTGSVYAHSVNARNGRAFIRWRTYNGTLISTSNGTTTALPANTWTRLTVTAAAPATAVIGEPGVEITDGVNTDITYLDGFMVDDGSSASAYVDGYSITASRLDFHTGPSDLFPSVQTTVPSVVPSVLGTYTGSITTAANPTVNFTPTPAVGDVLVLSDLRGVTSLADATAVSGCGATWTKVGPANSYIGPYWIGTGATSSGTITVTATGSASGRAVRVHHLRGVSPDVYIQEYKANYPVIATSNQIALAGCYTQNTTPILPITSTKPANMWTDDAEITFTSNRRFNSTHATPRFPWTFNATPDAYGMVLVIGSPVAGYTVTRRNLVGNSSGESGSGDWLTSGLAALGTSTLSAAGAASITGNYNGGPSILKKATGANGPFGPAVPGRTYTVSGYVRSTVARTAGIYPQWLGIGQGINSLGTYTGTALPANTWTRFSWTGVAPAGTYYVGVELKISDSASGDTFYFDGFLIEETDTLGDYFDGYSLPSPGKLNLLVGASDLFQSVQLTLIPPNLATLKQRESGVWVAHTGNPKAWVDGAWVPANGKRWNGSAWVELA